MPDETFQKIWDGKAATRRRLAELPFSEKVKILEKLRERQIIIKAAQFKV